MNAENKFVSPCLGGFCPRRPSCEHYVNPTDRSEPSERLCKRGEPDAYIPLGQVKRAGVPA